MIVRWKNILRATAIVLGGTATVAAVAEPAAVHAEALQWHSDFDAAATQAKANGQDMLVLFTGSDWCGACKRLKNEVLDRPEFAEAFNEFVLVELDFPMRGGRNAQLERNRALQQQFKVQGFPTLIHLDSDQNQVGQPIVGYSGGGPASYVAQVDPS